MDRLQKNWRVYLMEAICLGLFMVSACFFGTVLEYPNSQVHQLIPNDLVRLVLMGLAMGTTASAIIYSPMGKLSGAHMNPAVSFTFVRLGKMDFGDAVYYALFQCGGGLLAVYAMTILMGSALTDAPVNCVVTVPGKFGVAAAFIVEVTIAFCMMTTVLTVSNHPKWSQYTGVLAGMMVTSYVILAGPISGFGMNPARSLASAIPAMRFDSFWIYVVAPFLGMMTAAEGYRLVNGAVKCAKLHHTKFYDCIFDCGYCEHEAANTKMGAGARGRD